MGVIVCIFLTASATFQWMSGSHRDALLVLGMVVAVAALNVWSWRKASRKEMGNPRPAVQ
jgi:hypothetical protein